MIRATSWAAGAALLAMVGCTAAEPTEELPGVTEVDGVTITARDGQVLEGSYSDNLGSLEFTARANGPTGGQLVFLINGKRFDMLGELTTGYAEADGYGRVLTEDDQLLLASAAEPVMYALGVEDDNELPYFERMVIRNALFFSQTPNGVRHDFFSEGALPIDGVSFSLANDGIQRLKKWRLYKGKFDRGSTGRVHSFKCTTWKNWGTSRCGKGDYGCMGRCGSGCSGAGTKYPYRDCMEHDVCSHHMCARLGFASYHCGDEWRKAYDDFNNGV